MTSRTNFDPFISLALSMHANKGVFALLLGSGISRAAGIPTGWDVVLDLVRKVAHLEGADCEPDPASWYRARFGGPPDYSELLNTLAKTETERQQLLRPYFEPNDDEREQGLKQPTRAHRAIARLVASRLIRVIVTTNFDPLLELSLREVGVVPQVISTPDGVEGALPLVHAQCTIVKVHGDYLDTRIKNITAELQSYDPRIDQLLDQIFDEFGLIVCGWSADWDAALRAAIERCSSRRFTTFWATRGEPTPAAAQLIQHRRAGTIPIADGDSFFDDLVEKVVALDELAGPHPLSAPIAVARLKNYLVDPQHRIRLHDLMTGEANRLVSQLSDEAFPVEGVPFSQDEFASRLQRYEALVEVMQDLMITGCHWGESGHRAVWVKCLERIVNRPRTGNGLEVWLKLRRYPALILLYAGGIASIAAENYSTFAALLTQPKRIRHGQERSVLSHLCPREVVHPDLGKTWPGRERQYTALNNNLHDILRDPLSDFEADETRYQHLFDRFEYLFAMTFADWSVRERGYAWAPVGRFGWLDRDRKPDIRADSLMEAEIAAAGEDWPPLQAGLFGGSLEAAQAAKKVVDDCVRQLSWW